MDTRLLEEAKRLYTLTPCDCVRCGRILPFYHHDDHVCEACNKEEIDRNFDLFAAFREEIRRASET